MKSAATRLANALVPSGIDAVGKALITAARYTERYCTAKGPTLHLLDCVSMSLGPLTAKDGTPQKRMYHECATRLFEVIGHDLADFTKEEAIDMLVAAAYWNVPARITRHNTPMRRVTLLEELRIEAGMVPNRRGKLYGLAADRIEKLEAALRKNCHESIIEEVLG